MSLTSKGELNFKWNSLTTDDLSLILSSQTSNLLVRVTVVATDSDNGLNSQAILFLKFKIEDLFDQFNQKDKLKIQLIANNPFSKKITNDDFNKLTGNTFIDQQTIFHN